MGTLANIHARSTQLIPDFSLAMPQDEGDIDALATELAPFEQDSTLSQDQIVLVSRIQQELEQARSFFRVNATPAPVQTRQVQPNPERKGLCARIWAVVIRILTRLKELICCRRNQTPESRPSRQTPTYQARPIQQQRQVPANRGGGQPQRQPPPQQQLPPRRAPAADSVPAPLPYRTEQLLPADPRFARTPPAANPLPIPLPPPPARLTEAIFAAPAAPPPELATLPPPPPAPMPLAAPPPLAPEPSAAPRPLAPLFCYMDWRPILDTLPILTPEATQTRGTFTGTVNQFGAGQQPGGGNNGVAACAFCALNMLRRLWSVVSERRQLADEPNTRNFIDRVIREGVKLRAHYKQGELAINEHVSVADAWEAYFPGLLFNDLYVATADEVESQDNGARTYRNEIMKLQALKTPKNMIAAAMIKGPETHLLLIDQDRKNPRFYHFDSHGIKGGPGYIHVSSTPQAFAVHLTQIAPYVPEGGEANRLQIMPFEYTTT
ncbi:MAG TPA: hypothetical protein VLE89_03985 [Chlamydiales bacterium]|nr:hypothetical protein [Chlamydiales bacterium]